MNKEEFRKLVREKRRVQHREYLRKKKPEKSAEEDSEGQQMIDREIEGY